VPAIFAAASRTPDCLRSAWQDGGAFFILHPEGNDFSALTLLFGCPALTVPRSLLLGEPAWPGVTAEKVSV